MPSSSASSATDVDASAEYGSSQISALYMVRFDQKVGYTISWKRSAVDVPLDGVVEYKSLPSGLHAVSSDLVYFVHEDYAGLSAFASAPASAAQRNASFVAVGVLVPLSYGRLGRSWLHAARLQKIAASMAADADATALLEEFWAEQSQSRSKASPSPSSKEFGRKKHSRERALSTLTAVIPTEQGLPEFHPALAILRYLEVFGPLVFRLQQCALLRKRVLFVGSPPVRDMCEYVYNLSLLATIPSSGSELLPPGNDSLLRLRTLFSIGIHDIPLLESYGRDRGTGEETNGEDISQGWAACTTDEIIATKPKLYDIVIEIPHAYEAVPSRRKWATIKTSDGLRLRASQRDVQRYKVLQHEVRKYRFLAASLSPATSNSSLHDDNDETALLTRGRSNLEEDEAEDEADVEGSENFGDDVAEPMTWSRLAYLGFMWWASAGERDAYITAERDHDRELLGDLSDFSPNGLHTALIAYFHRSTARLIRDVAGLIEAADDDTGEEGEDGVLEITRDELSRIGLDTWSEADRAFLQEFLWCYFGKEAQISGANLDCCGVRIPVF